MTFLANISSRDVGLVTAGALGGLLLGAGVTGLLVVWRARRQGPQPPGHMRLYQYHTYRSSRVRWAIEELGLQKQCDILPYNPNTAPVEDQTWYKAHIHPNGLIPALELPHKKILYEGAAICFYLAEAQQKLLPPTEALEDYYSWSLYAACTLEPSVKILYVQHLMLKTGEQSPALQDTATRVVKEGMARLGQHLADRFYICGDSFTVADIIVGYTVMFASTIKGGTLLGEQPVVKGYLKRLKARPCFGRSVGTMKDWIQ